MKIKKIIISCLTALAVMAASGMAGCGRKNETVNSAQTEFSGETEEMSAEQSSTTAAEITKAPSAKRETETAETETTETETTETETAETETTEAETVPAPTTAAPTAAPTVSAVTAAPVTETPAETVPAPTTAAETAAETTAAQNTGHSNRRVFVGDSRVVQMENCCSGNPLDTWIAEGGQNYWWFVCTAVPQIQALLSTEQIDSVIIMMGVNDCAAAVVTGDSSLAYMAEYTSQINSLAAAYPNTAFYFCTVYYMDAGTWGNGAYHGWYNNEEKILYADDVNPTITSFNAAVCGNFHRIDVCSFVQNSGIMTCDGVHIIGNGAFQIYNYILGNLITY